MPLQVIGAGYPRTGTMSLKLALEQLGFGPCHHMIEILQHPEQATLWERKFSDEPIEWEEIFAGYNSATDAPTGFVYKDLAAHYPEAKVILSIRSPESWWQSAQATVMSPEHRERLAQSTDASPILSMLAKMREYLSERGTAMMGAANAGRDEAIAAFNRHNEDVQRSIAPERLLVFEASDGWKPLCSFLDVPVPDVPYPRANTREDFAKHLPGPAQASAETSR